jgi:ribosome biogenesis GTPase / thiamine phosphate phosphatase
MKKKRMEKKRRRQVRERQWDTQHEFAFSHDRARHRHAEVKLSESAIDAHPLPAEFTPNAMVIAHAKKWAFVQLEAGERLCIIDEGLQERDATLLAPGDRVLVEFEGEDAIVRGVSPRRTRLSRPGGPHARLKEQVIAANIDLLIIVTAAMQPPFRPGLVDRYLIAAQVCGVAPVLCVNKMDLVASEPEALSLYRELGIDIVLASCVTGQGLEDLRRILSGKISVLSGHSGVGKSSLLNALDPELRVYTTEVSESTRRGRHATTAARLYALEGGIRIIDTPGIRALGLWGVSPEELAFYFPELAEAVPGCKFRNCTHTHEPACAVREAVASGTIQEGRYQSYLRIRASLESKNNLTPGRRAPANTTRMDGQPE